ncbi:MAG TPA: RidA family protein [Tissierellaceae bacterium]|nr:RidA family protein [Tissierellaceae bacterium]
MSVEFINTDKAPAAVGPYSQGMKVGNTVYTSGQLHIDPETGKMIEGDIQEMTKLAIENVLAVLEEAGASLENIVKLTVFVKDMEQFSSINEVYAEFFSDHKPARSLVEVAKLPLDGQIEIEAIAVI